MVVWYLHDVLEGTAVAVYPGNMNEMIIIIGLLVKEMVLLLDHLIIKQHYFTLRQLS